MKIKISKSAFAIKPGLDEMSKITNEIKYNKSVDVDAAQLAKYISKGHSFILADYVDDCNSIKEEFIRSISFIALDIDSKENKITMNEMIQLVHARINITPIVAYRTFSDVDSTKFRLIYKLEVKIDTQTFRKLYNALEWKFDKYIDRATKNPNRIWAGTNKEVVVNKDSENITMGVLVKILNSYDDKIKRDNKKKKLMNDKLKSFDTCIINSDFFIKKEYKELVMDYIMDNISLKDFIENKFGGNFQKKGENFVGACVLHGGDNKGALVIGKRIYTCFTHCGTGNIFTIAKRVYKTDDISLICLKLASEYNLNIPDDYIVTRGGKDGGCSNN